MYWKSAFHYIEPQLLKIRVKDTNVADTVPIAYVPLVGTLKVYLDEIRKHLRSCAACRNGSLTTNQEKDCHYSDVHSGLNFKTNPFFSENPNALQLILYQDGLELVNPIGASKGIHKVIAYYLTIGNLQPHLRSLINQMQLVLLVKEKDLKLANLHDVLKPLTDELLDLEKTGFEHNDQHYKAAVLCITGDNLGQHTIGGFMESFSCHYFCRYCRVERTKYKADPLSMGEIRTPTSYRITATAVLNSDPVTPMLGIKGRSPFDVLQYFKICRPGLPPCIGHDIFEGVIRKDLMKMITYFVKKKWITYDALNTRINEMTLFGRDAKDKPVGRFKELNPKIICHAVQCWVLLRMFPLYMRGCIVDPNDDVWKLYLLLREITEFICSPTILESQVIALEEKICKYMTLLQQCFPGPETSSPKHHYMVHYPDLIRFFGPLIRVWAMGFEHKHQFLKHIIQSAQNFINILKMIAERHQLCQALSSEGQMLPSCIVGHGKSVDFNDVMTVEPPAVFKAFEAAGMDFDNLTQHSSITVRGTEFKCGVYIPLYKDTLGKTMFAKLYATLLTSSCKPVFVATNAIGTYLNTGLYLINDTEEYIVLSYNALYDPCPLHAYTFGEETFISLKHCVPFNFEIAQW
jgi:hypothetical protein